MSSFQPPQNIVYETWLRLEENDVAAAAVLLWNYHKDQRQDWIKVKVALLKDSNCHKEIFLMANLLGVAEKADLSSSYHLVPGLYALCQRSKNRN